MERADLAVILIPGQDFLRLRENVFRWTRLPQPDRRRNPIPSYSLHLLIRNDFRNISYVKNPIERLREVTREREKLRKEWDAQRNLDVLNLLHICIPAMFQCERFGLFIRDSSSDSLWLECGTGVTERSIVVGAKGSMVGEAIETRGSIIQNDLSIASGAHHIIGERQSGFEARNALTVPIFDIGDGASIGAIQLLNHKPILLGRHMKRSDSGDGSQHFWRRCHDAQGSTSSDTSSHT